MKLLSFLWTNAREALLLTVALAAVWLLGLPLDRVRMSVPEVNPSTVALYEAGVRWFVALALAGWVALLAGRMPWPLLASGAGVVAVWLLYWVWVQPVAQPLVVFKTHRLGLTVLAFTLFFGAWLLAFTLRQRLPSVAGWLLPRGPGSALAYPGFVLFTGLGFLWLMDLLVNGHYSGVLLKEGALAGEPLSTLRPLKLAQDLSAAYALLTLTSALAPALMRWLLVAGGAVSRRLAVMAWRWRAALAIGLTVAVCLGLAVFFRQMLGSAELRQMWTPRLVEAVRLPLLLGLGYLFYRWLEAGERMTSGFRWAFAWMAASALAAFLAFGEKGQMLITLATMLMLGLAAWFEYGFVRGSPTQRFAPLWTLATALALLAALSWALHAFGNTFGAHIGDRLDAMHNPGQAREDFLAVLRWFSAEAGLSGFGLGQVPWCGYSASLGETCGKSTGVPFQIESDYAFFGLVGVWGTLGALLICCGLMAWLVLLLLALLPRRRSLLNLALLQGWLVGVWAVVMLVQVCLTVLGGLGQFVLTGVPLPMMASGLASIVSISIFVGLASSQVDAYSR